MPETQWVDISSTVPKKTDTNNIYKIYPSYDEKRTDENESIRRELHKTKNSKGYD
ncbi:MAG: hypothetical protein ACJ705_00035 [Nitrososphaeraceae archaeon]